MVSRSVVSDGSIIRLKRSLKSFSPIACSSRSTTLDKEDQPRLLRILIDPESPFDGEATKELRRVVTEDGLRFFELRVPIVLTRVKPHG